MSAPQAKDTLRLPRYHNEWVEVVGFEQRKPGHQWPDTAVFTTGDYMKTAVVNLFREDHLAFKHAGFDLMGKVGDVNPPIDVLIQNDRVAAVRAADGTEHGVVRREMTPVDVPALQIVTNALPATNPENGDVPTPLAFVEPQAPAARKSSDDGGNGSVPGKARLYAKIAAVMGKVGAVGERGLSGQGYNYVTDGDLFAAVRAEMATANLAMLPPRLLRRYADGADMMIDIEFAMADGDTGEVLTTPWIAKLGNTTDKAIHAAMTMCVKYYLKYTFLISTEKDADADTEKDTSASGQPKRKTPKQAVEDVQTGTAVIHFIEVRVNEDKSGKPYIVAEGGYVTHTRNPFREGSIPCEDWDKPGKYTLPAPVLITYKVKGTGPKEITGATWAEDVEATPEATKSEPDAGAAGNGNAGTPPAVANKRKPSDMMRLPDEADEEMAHRLASMETGGAL